MLGSNGMFHPKCDSCLFYSKSNGLLEGPNRLSEPKPPSAPRWKYTGTRFPILYYIPLSYASSHPDIIANGT